VDVVATSLAVVDPQDGIEVGEQFLPRQELAQHLADDRRAPEAAADEHAKAELARGIAHQVQADVVHLGGGPVGSRAGDGDLELARQVGEFRVQRRPLADDLAVGARVIDLIRGDARQVIGGDVAHAVAARLDGVHLHGRQFREDVRDLLEFGPVQLQILAGREVPEAAVVAARDVGELAQLAYREQAIGDRDAQHRRVALQVESVAQPQRLELVFRELARQVTARLVAELAHALVHEGLIEFVILVHGASTIGARPKGAKYRLVGCTPSWVMSPVGH
jgi:hypothetical protein